MEYNIEVPGVADWPRLVEVWEASVRATHGFVSEADIHLLKNIIIEQQIFLNTNLICVRNSSGEVEGFAGTSGDSLDMLFVSPAVFGSGVGKALISYAISALGVSKVDVNEQNESARGFYEHFGFFVAGRSATDDYGLPFPILHMRRLKG